MKVIPARNLVCPIDGKKLTAKSSDKPDDKLADYTGDRNSISSSLICGNGHNFDFARQGYLNLLVVQHKASRDPGDTKEMVTARRRFLETGSYEAIATEIANLTEKHLADMALPATIPATILDAGCGEGYYLTWLLEIAKKWMYPQVGVMIGMDISKWAIQAAAKRDRQITWIVGSNARPPFSPSSIDLILCAFGFPSFDIFYDILKPKGKIIMVDPALNHLIELRQLIYPELRQRVSPVQNMQIEGFNLVDSSSLTYKAEVNDRQAVQDLFLMTPHYFRSPPEAKTTIAALQKLEFTVDVSFRTLVKY